MLRISKLTDYGTVLLAHLAENQVPSAVRPTSPRQRALRSRRSVSCSNHWHVPGSSRRREAPTAATGWPDHLNISAADVIDALEGPVSITECSSSDGDCEHEGVCSVGGAWQRINVAIRRALDDVTLNDLLRQQSGTDISFCRAAHNRERTNGD